MRYFWSYQIQDGNQLLSYKYQMDILDRMELLHRLWLKFLVSADNAQGAHYPLDWPQSNIFLVVTIGYKCTVNIV